MQERRLEKSNSSIPHTTITNNLPLTASFLPPRPPFASPRFLSEGSPSSSLEWLNKASALTNTTSIETLLSTPGGVDPTLGPSTLVGLRILTLNNQACHSKSASNFSSARNTLQQAIEESELNSTIGPGQRAVTHSNMSAVLSAMGKHEGARRHAKLGERRTGNGPNDGVTNNTSFARFACAPLLHLSRGLLQAGS